MDIILIHGFDCHIRVCHMWSEKLFRVRQKSQKDPKLRRGFIISYFWRIFSSFKISINVLSTIFYTTIDDYQHSVTYSLPKASG